MANNLTQAQSQLVRYHHRFLPLWLLANLSRLRNVTFCAIYSKESSNSGCQDRDHKQLLKTRFDYNGKAERTWL